MSEIKILPVLPLRDIVVFPHMVVPLFVGRDKSVRALDEVMRGDKQILLATQKNSSDDDPAPLAAGSCSAARRATHAAATPARTAVPGSPTAAKHNRLPRFRGPAALGAKFVLVATVSVRGRLRPSVLIVSLPHS